MTMKKYENRGISTDALIVKNKKILLIKRKNNPFKGSWAFPGGYVDFNETVEQACRREVKEETNMNVIKLDLLGVYSSPKRDARQVISIAFITKATGKPRAGDDAADARWFPLNRLPRLVFDHAQMMRDYKKRLVFKPRD